MMVRRTVAAVRPRKPTNDAEAIAEAASRPIMRFVTIETEAQQARAMLFRTRDMLVRQRTQTINASCQRHASGMTWSSRRARRCRATGCCSGETTG